MSPRRKSPDVAPLSEPALGTAPLVRSLEKWAELPPDQPDPDDWRKRADEEKTLAQEERERLAAAMTTILGILAGAGCQDPEVHWSTIEDSIRFTRARLRAKEDPAPVSSKRVGDELARVVKHTGALRKALEDLSPAARDALEQSGRHSRVDWTPRTTLGDLCEVLEDVAHAAATWSEPVVGADLPKVRLRAGRRDPAKWWLVESLANIYREATGKAPKVWPSKDGSGEYEGPFPEFVRAAWVVTTSGLPPEEGGGPPWLDHYLAEVCKLFKGT